MKRKLKKEEAQHLRQIIEYMLGVNVTHDKSRKRNVVNARVIFSQILKECGYGSSCISRELNKHHATVLHYFHSYEWNVSQDDELRISYLMVKEEFEKEYDPIYTLSEVDLKKEIYSLRSKNKELYSQIIGMEMLLSKETKKNKRLIDIVSLIKERTRRGTEDEILIKLKTFYNGVYGYGNR